MAANAGILFDYPITNPLSAGPTPAIGQILSGCSLVFYLTTTTTATPVYSDGALAVSLGNTVNANASGQFVPLYMNPSIVYRVQLWSGNNGTGTKLQDIDPYVVPGIPSQAIIGSVLFPQTPAELAAAVTPVNYQYEPWRGEDVRRFGAVGDGATDNTAFLATANLIGSALYFPPGIYAIASNLTLSVPCIFDYGAILKPASTTTTTINAPVDAGPWQIFNEIAGGVISGLIRPINADGRMYFEWWGAKGDNATDDTVACQATLRAASTANYIAIQMLPKQYRITAMLNLNGTAAQNVKAVSIYGVGARVSQFTTATAGIYLTGYFGVSGTTCDAVIEGVGFAGVTATTIAIKINGQCGLRFRRCLFDTLATGIHFYNLTAGVFTEFCMADECEWSTNCTTPLLYQVGAGSNSFHGSGMRKGIITSNTAGPLISIGAGARPYGAPLDGQIFYASNCTLINNASTQLVDFLGSLTTENLGAGTLTLAAGGAIPFVGTINCSQQNVLGGTLVQMQAMISNDNGIQTFLGGRKAYKTAITTGANTLTSAFFNQHRLVYIRFVATGYDFRYLLSVDADGAGGAGIQGTLLAIRATNTAGYGAPVFTVNALGNLVATQAGWPASGVTCYWSEQCVSYGNETLETAQI